MLVLDVRHIDIAGETHDDDDDKGKGPELDIALLHDEYVLRSALQSWKWQLIGMS